MTPGLLLPRRTALARALALAAGLACAQAALAAAPDGADRRQLVAAACDVVGAPGAALQPLGDRQMEVRCLPHRELHAVPVARYARCEKKAGSWRCGTDEDVLLMEPRPGSKVAVTGEGIAVRALIELFRESARLTYLPFHNPASWLMQDRCHVRPAEGNTFKGGALFEINCTPGTLSMTRDCWNNRCRYFVTAGREYAGAAAGGTR